MPYVKEWPRLEFDMFHSRETYLRLTGALVEDVGHLQLLSVGDILKIPETDMKNVQEIKAILGTLDISLRGEKVGRQQRVREVFRNPNSVPCSHLRTVSILTVQAVVKVHKLGLMYYGDFTRVTRSGLQKQLNPQVVEKIGSELKQYGIKFLG